MSGDRPGREKGPAVEQDILDDLAKRFTGFAVPDQPFDPSKASPELLRRYGLPPKPDPDRQPLLRRIWDQGFARTITLLPFTFERDLVEKADYRLFSRKADEMSFSGSRFETSRNWSGAYVTANQDRQFLQVWGIWTIPNNLQLPPAPQQGPPDIPYVCSNWIGLDGQRLYLDSTLPQIGTVSMLEVGGTTTAQAWTQWWARQGGGKPPVPIPLTVNPGDEVLCVLTAWDPQTVIWVMVNLSTGPTGMAVQGTAPTVTLPDGSTVLPDISGATAEWILERPEVLDTPTRYNFPDYGQTGFGDCVAVEGDGVDIGSWFGGLAQELQGARRIRMFDVLLGPERTAFISMPHKASETSIRVTYGGF
jgi:hypothetical protein